MKHLVFALIFLATALPAQARPASASLTCAAAASLVRQQGAVLFDTSRTTFDRFVRDGSFCPLATSMRPGIVQARDRPDCFVGYTCDPQIPLSPMRN